MSSASCRDSSKERATTPLWGAALVLALATSGCGGCAPSSVGADGGGPGDEDGGAPGPLVFPLFDVTTDTMADAGVSVAAVGLSQPGADLVAAVFSSGSPADLWLTPVNGAAPPKVVLSGVAAPAGAPRVVRTAGGTVHVVWEANGEIHHATGQGDSGWSTATVQRGKNPSLALGADGRVHAAWVGLKSATWTAFYGGWNGSSWDIEAVRSIQSGVQWCGVATMGSTVVLAGTNPDGTLWVVVKDGAAWVDQPLNVAEFIQFSTSHDHAIAGGPAGVAIVFGSNPRTYAAWRPAGSDRFQVGVVGEQFTNLIVAPQVRVGTTAAVAAAAHNLRLSAWARSTPFWPRLASFPSDHACAQDARVALSLDVQDQPVLVAYGCAGDMRIYRQVGTYPGDWRERCQSAVTQLCDLACACGSAPGDCAYVYSSGRSPGGNRWGCELGALDDLCGDSTSPPDELGSCVATLQPATCRTLGYPVNDACLPLIE